MTALLVPDPHDVAVVRSAPPLLAAFNAGGVLAPADVHAACTLARLAGEDEPAVLLAAALAVRAPRLAHVCVDLARVRDTVTVEGDDPVDVDALPWPDAAHAWRAVVAASPLVADGAEAGDAPLRLVDDRLYLDRYWRYEQRVLAALLDRAQQRAAPVDRAALRAGLDRLFGPPAAEADLQRLAAAAAVLGRLAVVAGGPGTGKTHTLSRVLVLLADQARAAGLALPRVALAAPTGKAAQRMGESLTGAVDALEVEAEVRAWLLALEGVTLHRLLRRHPGNRTRFRHDARNPLPHDAVIVDETSMAALSLVAKLLEAIRPDARLVLIGDPEQLASVEAGSVLGDLVGRAEAVRHLSAQARADLAEVTGEPLAHAGSRAGPVADRIVVLQRGYRFHAGIADLAAAIQAGDGDAVVALLAAGRGDVRWLPLRVEDPRAATEALAPVRSRVAEIGAALLPAAAAGDAEQALACLERMRILCAHRRGSFGVASWVPLVERWLGEDAGLDAREAWHLGRPVLVTRNDYQVGVLNGDVGVTVVCDGALTVAFRKGDQVRFVSPTRLEHVETVHAMTIHKAQGSEFEEVAVVLPKADSPILTRELLYTAATRARLRLTVVGEEEAVRTAVARRVQRASGLRDALWGPASRNPPRVE